MIRVYHHIYPTKEGLKISDEQKQRLYEKILQPFEYFSNIVKLHQAELWTLKMLQNDCKELNNETPILYIHTKGATKPTIERQQWREYMERELIDNYKFHLDILKKGFSTSGVLMGIPYWSSKFYGGNFWWTTAGYIKTLPDDLGWKNWNPNNSESPSREMNRQIFGWAEIQFINQGINYNPFTIPFFEIEGVEQFALLIRKEIQNNKNVYKNKTIKNLL